MYENCACFKFHDVTLTWIIRFVFTFASNYYQTATVFIPGGHFILEKIMILGNWQV